MGFRRVDVNGNLDLRADGTLRPGMVGPGLLDVANTRHWVPEELEAFVISGTKKWAEIVKAAGIQPE